MRMNWFYRAILSYFLVKGILLLSGYFFAGNTNSFFELLQLFSKNDSAWYQQIASAGYPSTLPVSGGQSSFPFFPLYPLLLSIGHVFPGGYVTWAFVLSCALGLAWIRVLFLYFRQTGKSDAMAFRMVLLMMVFPWHYFFHAFYSEQLFLLLLTFAFYFLEIKRPFLLFISLFLLALTRPTGLIFAAGMVPIFMEKNEITWSGLFRVKMGLKLWPFAGAAAGLFSFMAYLYFRCGDALAFSHAQSGWGRGWDWPWVGFFSKSGWENVLISIWVILLILLSVFVIRRQTPGVKIFVGINLLFPLITGSLMSYYRMFAVNLKVFELWVEKTAVKTWYYACMGLLLLLNICAWYYWCQEMGELAY